MQLLSCCEQGYHVEPPPPVVITLYDIVLEFDQI